MYLPGSTDKCHHRQQAVFKPDNIQIVEALPADVLKQVRAWDFGATENEGDFTVGVREALGADGFTYIVDVTRGQLGPDNVNKRLEQTAKLDGKKFLCVYHKTPVKQANRKLIHL